MKKYGLLFISLLLLAGIYRGDNATDFSLWSTSGEQVNLSDLRGRIVVLILVDGENSNTLPLLRRAENELWQPCLREKLVYLYVVVSGKSREECNTIVSDLNLSYPLLADPSGEVISIYDGSDDLPICLIVGRDQVIEYREDSFLPNSIENKVNQLIASSIHFTTWWKIKELFHKNR